MARRYHAGVPDPIRVQRVDNRTRMRAMLNSKLNSLVIPELNGLDGFTMEEAVEALETAFRTNDPEKTGFQMFINPYVDPGGVPIQNTGGGGGGPAGGGPAGPGGGVGGLDPTTGLPMGAGPAMGGPGGPGGAQGVDPTTGLPLGPAAGGAPPGVGGTGAPGLPGVGGPGAALPGMGGGGAGLPGIGGGGAGGGDEVEAGVEQRVKLAERVVQPRLLAAALRARGRLQCGARAGVPLREGELRPPHMVVG